MALGHSPKIVTDGLVFYYDMENSQKSWKGAPATNLITDPQFNNSGYWSTWSGRGTSSWSYATLDGKSVVYTDMSIQNTETHQLFRDITVPAVLNTYALSLDVLVASDCTASSVLMNTEYPFGNSFGTSSYNMSNKGTWQRLYAIRDNAYTGVTSNPQNRIRFYFGSNDTNKVGKIYFTNAQLELGSFATPFVNGTRSNTQALLDLTGQKTITANSLTYASDGTFNFNGSNNYITIPNPVASNLPHTIMQWVKIDQALTDTTLTTGRKTPLVGPGPQWSPGYWLTARKFRVHSYTQYRDHTINWVNYTGWRQIGQVYDGVNCYGIIDGQILSGGTTTAYSPGLQTSILIGAENTTGNSFNWNGQSPVLKIYDRTLTATEVAQNFNATRSRYGV